MAQLVTPLDLNLVARLLYKTLSERIGDDEVLRGELEAVFDILDPLVDTVERQGQAA
jgi:hypothetical protein